MRQATLNQEKRVNTKDVSLDGFIVEERLATHLTQNERKPIFTVAELRNIQNRKRTIAVNW